MEAEDSVGNVVLSSGAHTEPEDLAGPSQNGGLGKWDLGIELSEGPTVPTGRERQGRA
jgi:hypothetical protein